MKELTTSVSIQDRIYAVDGIGKTQAAMAGGGGAKMGLVDDESSEHFMDRIRRLTPIESGRLQGFPDDWSVGSDTAKYKGYGNAVTTNVVEAVANKLFDGWAESGLSRTVRYISCFSGIGGFELGIQRAADRHNLDTNCLGYSEIDKNAIATYERNFPQHVSLGDITTLDADELPSIDLLVGGFPCQAFSIAGARRGFEDTRGTLFFDLARILAARRPRHFIFENVKGLLSHEGGRTFRTIIAALDELGYCVEWQVLNSKDFGVPQNRERVYIVGHLGGIRGRAVLPEAGQGNPYSTVSESAETAVARTFTAGGNTGGNHSGMTIISELPTPPAIRGLLRREQS